MQSRHRTSQYINLILKDFVLLAAAWLRVELSADERPPWTKILVFSAGLKLALLNVESVMFWGVEGLDLSGEN